jgi:HD-GYP domain-containing protein (c-di-GMP phosphodiesterase class II)
VKLNIDKLIDIVSKGGVVKTGVDIYNSDGVLLLEKNVLVQKVNTLLVIKKCGVSDIHIDPSTTGGMWDKSGNPLPLDIQPDKAPAANTSFETADVERKLKKISEQKKEASVKYEKAKNNIKKIIAQIQETGGEFDFALVEETVSDIINLITRNDAAFSYLTKEIFSYDDYLYNHSVSVCTIATAIINRFNNHYSNIVNQCLGSLSAGAKGAAETQIVESYINYLPGELQDMSVGYFLHDVGKVLIPEKILNKPGRLSSREFEVVQKHSFEKGPEILENNRIKNPVIKNIITYHHSALFPDEQRCYPGNKLPVEIPPYVKVAKLADIYDAMTSKRCYKEALNPVSVVTEIYRKYANKDQMLQFLLHAFVKIVGIYPPGSVLTLQNGQLCYVLDSQGPMVIPITDAKGNTLTVKPNPIDFGTGNIDAPEMQIDRRKPLKTPIDVYDSLPSYLKESHQIRN